MQQLTVKSIFEKDTTKQKLEQMLGKKAQGFITSVLQISTNNALLAKADPLSVYNAAMIAATLDLPINQNLGFAWIVPYRGQAQFQMGWKGYVQLAQRTGQYKRINVTKVYENQFIGFNYLTEELNADFSLEPSGAVVGYAAYFQLHNGYEKLVYWTKKQAEEHGRRFSQSFNNGPWKSDFDAMAMKTVLKNTLSKWGILSIEMQTAVRTDSAVIKDENGTVVQYVDNADAVEQLPLITEEQLEQAKKEIMEGNCYLEDVTALYDLYPEQIEYLKN
jgi:recombination protein RecT